MKYDYPGYIADPGRLERQWFLLGLSLFEADFGRRLIVSVLCGALIGFERRSADRPAGIRTMSLASLGGCLFTICGTFGFMNGPNKWDASRISAALPSGVGFLGAGIIWKGTSPASKQHRVRGLTTAASVWISAATGCACGGGLYFPAVYGSVVAITVLRYGPKMYLQPDWQREVGSTQGGSIDEEETEDEDENDDCEEQGSRRHGDQSMQIVTGYSRLSDGSGEGQGDLAREVVRREVDRSVLHRRRSMRKQNKGLSREASLDPRL